MAAKNGVSRKKQQEIPGTAPPDQVDAIDDAMADYLNGREALANVRTSVEREREALLELLRQHKRKVYVYRDGVYRFTVRLHDKSQLKITRDHEKADEATRPKRARRSAGGGALADAP